MSLFERVTSVEQLSPERGRSPVSSHRDRKLSFSPLPGDWEAPAPKQHVQPIGAFEVPRAKRIRAFPFCPLRTVFRKSSC